MGDIDFSTLKVLFITIGTAAEITFLISFILIWSWTMRGISKDNLKEYTVMCWRCLMISVTIMTGVNIGELVNAYNSGDQSAIASALGSMGFRLLVDIITIWATIINNRRALNTLGDGEDKSQRPHG